MKNLTTYILIAVVAVMFSSCAKDGKIGPTGATGTQGPPSGTSNPNIYNKWQVISGMNGAAYLIINSDNSYYELDSATYGFKTLNSGTALITGSQIQGGMYNNFSGTYDYSISNDTLKLTNINGTAILVKNSNAPDKSTWITFVTLTDSINPPVTGGDYREDMGFDGVNILWAGDYDSDTIYQINPTTHLITGKIFIGSANICYYGQINYASSFIWISNSEVVYKISPLNPTVIISTSPQLSTLGSITGMALVGQYMWYCDWAGNIYTWDVNGTTVTKQFNFPVSGMEYVNGFLYMNEGNYVYKCQVSPFQVLTTYQISPTPVNSFGITYDGSKFWIIDLNKSKLYRLSI